MRNHTLLALASLLMAVGCSPAYAKPDCEPSLGIVAQTAILRSEFPTQRVAVLDEELFSKLQSSLVRRYPMSVDLITSLEAAIVVAGDTPWGYAVFFRDSCRIIDGRVELQWLFVEQEKGKSI